MAAVDPMYQFSLPWYIGHFHASMEAAAPASQPKQRLGNLKATFLRILYVNVCRSLFEKDKLLFSLLLTITINKAKGEVDADEWRFFLTGLPVVSAAAAAAGPIETEPNPAASWLPELAWLELNALSTLPAFDGLAREVRTDRIGLLPGRLARLYEERPGGLPS
jgi:dynein heavy chain